MKQHDLNAFSGRAGSGFTAVEIIITIVAVSILAAAAMVGVKTYVSAFRLNAAAAKVLFDIRYAQQQARARNGWFGVRFQANPINRYNVYYTDGTSDIDLLDPANPAQVLDVDTAASFGGVQITGVVFGAGDKVEFSPVGVPHDDGMAGSPLSSDGTLTLSLGSSSRTIKVLKNTGRAEVQ